MLPCLARPHGIARYGLSWGRTLYSRLVAAGLVNVEAAAHFEFRQGGSPGARLDKANLCQVRDELLRKH